MRCWELYLTIFIFEKVQKLNCSHFTQLCVPLFRFTIRLKGNCPGEEGAQWRSGIRGPFAKSMLIVFGPTPFRYIADETGRVIHDITNKESYRRQFEAIQHCFRIIGFTDKVSDCQEKKKLKCSYSWINMSEDVNVLIWRRILSFPPSSDHV